MKKAKLPNGQILIFPDGTSEKVINDTVKRITSSKGNMSWDSEQVKTIIREMTAAAGDIDLERAQIDHFGPAIKTQTEMFEKSNNKFINTIQDFTKNLLTSQNDKLSDIVSRVSDKPALKIEKALIEVAKQVIAIANKLEVFGVKVSRNNADLVEAINNNTRAVNSLISLYDTNNSIMRDLVNGVTLSKRIVRNESGEIIGVEVIDDV